MLTFFSVVLAAIIFEYSNGFHDAANAIATVVSTRVLTPRKAIAMAAFFNLTGALFGGAVASTIGKGLVDTNVVSMTTVLSAVIAAFTWNITTWWFGLPSSSSHALIGGLCGAALAAASGNWWVIKWSLTKVDLHTGAAAWDGLLPKVILPMLASPVAGLIGGYLVMMLLFLIVRNWTPWAVNKTFGKLQLLSASYMAWGHGFADAQKTMGVIALATFAATKAGKLEHLPPMFGFLYSPKFEVHTWIKVACAVILGLGTWAGGWRIIRTLGHKLVTMRPIHGFAAETTGATILLVAGKFGLPVSTTHAITTSIMGVGVAKQPAAFNKVVAERIVWAWIFTIPGAGGLAYVLFRALSPFIAS